MRRGTMTAFLGAVALTAALVAVSTPASARTVGPVPCSSDASVNGSTEGTGQITYEVGAAYGTCGTLGLRVNYTHVGGSSWTAWKYSSWGGGYVSYNVGNNAYKSQHTTSVGSLNFVSYR